MLIFEGFLLRKKSSVKAKPVRRLVVAILILGKPCRKKIAASLTLLAMTERSFSAGLNPEEFAQGADGPLFQPGYLRLGDAHQPCHIHLGLAIVESQSQNLLFPL